jgi:hypothetical protein
MTAGAANLGYAHDTFLTEEQLSWTFLIRLLHPSFLPGQLALLDVRYYTVQYCIVLYCIPSPPTGALLDYQSACIAFMEVRDFM